jgi:predicted ATPase/DNA-binding SARP family transcriptional activator
MAGSRLDDAVERAQATDEFAARAQPANLGFPSRYAIGGTIPDRVLESRPLSVLSEEVRVMPLSAMPTLHIHLLGEFRLLYADTPLNQLTAPRVQALLAYLVLHRAAPQPRQRLAFLLWPDSSEVQARTNLRQLLHALKQALPEADRFVHFATQTLQWRPDAPFRLDVAEYEQALTQAAEAERHQDTPILRAMLQHACDIYQGDLLPSCYDDWILPERERLRQAYAGALERLLLLLESQREPRAALAYTQRLLRHDPLREKTYRALMRLHAAHGDRAMVRRVYQTCTAVLERELGVEPSAATRHAYEQALTMDVQAEPLTTPHAATVKTNLPVQLTSFIGRKAELAAVSDLLQTTRLLTLTGPGGTGKTRLALEVAVQRVGSYPQGVWLVELAPLADAALLLQTLATTLGVREQPGRPLLDALLDYLRAKSLLLLLDNCEHLIETCAQLVETVLHAARGVTILASSREALGIAGETPYRVPPLALPDPRHLQDLDALSQNDCVRLFVERAATAYPPFCLTAHNAPAITQIVRRLDGIPLAIELAAARSSLLPPEQIAAHLDDRFRLLTGGSRTALPRHQTLLALIDWSHELLSDAERVMLRRLAVFAGGFSLEAAQAVCDECDVGLIDEALDTLARLADKSLVEVDTSSEAAEGRFRLLETVRQYTREKLLQAGEAEAVRDRHLAFFLQYAKEAEPKLRSAKQLAWLDRLETEYDNLRTALAWALERGTSDQALELAGALAYFWVLRGYFSEGLKWLDEALMSSERERDKKVAAGISTPIPVEMAHRAKALYAACWCHFATFGLKRARTTVEESLRLWRELGDRWWTAVALELQALLMSFEHDYETALARLEEGVSLARELEDPWPLATCLIRFGDALKPRGEAARARPYMEEGVAVARRVGDNILLSEGLRELGALYYAEGNLKAAASLTAEALAHGRATRSLPHIFLALFQLVIIACLQGDPAKAKGYSIESWALAKDTGSLFAVGFTLWCFGLAASFGGEAGRGVRLLAATDTILRQQGIDLTGAEGEPSVKVYKQALEKAQRQLGPAAFEAAWTAGQQLTVEQAIALATEDESKDAALPEIGR